jgi:hypothetical protein
MLIDIAKNSPELLAGKTIQQFVGMCGDGHLRDGNACSSEFRKFLEMGTPEDISGYARFCVDNKFEKSGEVLQDCVNEIGRRLSYTVENGRYSGVKNDIGFDGLWLHGQHHLLVEVKTTDAYRINLDTIANYGSRLRQTENKSFDNFSILIVVGRQDTGDLEAQVRGSKHAWSVRLISVDALSKLMLVNAQFQSPQMLEKIRRILLPFEYTRVDNIVELVFETQQETEIQLAAESDVEEGESVTRDSAERSGRKFEFTPREELDNKRREIVSAFFSSRKLSFEQESKTHFIDSSGNCHVVCAVSKRYMRDHQPYWYALHPQWLENIRSGKEGYFILGCMDNRVAYVLPVALLESHLDSFNMTEKPEGKSYWHVALNMDDGVIKLNLSKIGTKIDLTPYRMEY